MTVERHHVRRSVARVLVAGATATTAAIGAAGAGAVPAVETDVRAPSQSSTLYAYDIQASYVLAHEEVDATTSLRRVSEVRIDWQLAGKRVAASDGQFNAGSGLADGGAVRISVRDERTSPPCERTSEGANKLSVGFYMDKNRSRVELRRYNASTPTIPCQPGFIQQLQVTTGALDGSFADQGGATIRSTGLLDPAFAARIAAGRSAESTIELTPTTARPGLTQRATVTLKFTRNPAADPKPSSKRLVIKGPVVGIARVQAAAAFVVYRGGDLTGMSRSKSRCSGRFAGGRPPLDGTPLLRAEWISVVTDRIIADYSGFRGGELARVLRQYRGKRIALVSCGFTTYVGRFYEEHYKAVCGKTFSGALKVVYDNSKVVTKRFSFVWKDPRQPCTG